MQPKNRAPFLAQLSPFILLWPYRGYHCTKNTQNFYKYWDISAVYALCRNPGRHLCHMESPWSHLHVCYEQGCTTCCSLAAGLRENGERMGKWKGNGERMRKWREIYSLRFLIAHLSLSVALSFLFCPAMLTSTQHLAPLYHTFNYTNHIFSERTSSFPKHFLPFPPLFFFFSVKKKNIFSFSKYFPHFPFSSLSSIHFLYQKFSLFVAKCQIRHICHECHKNLIIRAIRK